MSLEASLRSQTEKAAVAWRELVLADADSGQEPSLAAITKIAAPLGLTAPEAVDKFRADVALVRSHRDASADVDRYGEMIDEILAKHGGSLEDLVEAAERAEAKAIELKQAAASAVHVVGAWHGTAVAERDRIAASRPDLFPIPIITSNTEEETADVVSAH
jgi:hypothetical protein